MEALKYNRAFEVLVDIKEFDEIINNKYDTIHLEGVDNRILNLLTLMSHGDDTIVISAHHPFGKVSMSYTWDGWSDMGINEVRINLFNLVGFSGSTSFTDTSDRLMTCNAYPFLDSVEKDDVPDGYKHTWYKVQMDRDVIRPGNTFVRSYIVGCDGRPYIYNANKPTHDVCVALDMFSVNGC